MSQYFIPFICIIIYIVILGSILYKYGYTDNKEVLGNNTLLNIIMSITGTLAVFYRIDFIDFTTRVLIYALITTVVCFGGFYIGHYRRIMGK